jgi:hypothetical protein
MKTKVIFRRGTLMGIIGAALWIIGLIFATDCRGQLTPVNFDGAPALNPGQLETSL